jgi:hypothetical protein
MFYMSGAATASVQSDREKNFWISVSESAIVGFRIWQYRRQIVGWSAGGGETQQNLESFQPNLQNLTQPKNEQAPTLEMNFHTSKR